MVFSIACWIALAISLVGALYGLLVAAVVAIAHALFLAHVRGNGVRIGPDQLPSIWSKVVNASSKLGLAAPPEVIVMQSGGVLNAFATKLLGRRFVILHSELVDACQLASGPSIDGQPDELDFVIGHEIGHLAAGHLSWILLPARLVPLLGPAYSRACEYTCDRCGHAVVGDLARSSRALAVLAAGGRCAARINLDALVAQRADAGYFWSAVYELNASHPYLSKRIAALREHTQPGTEPAFGRNPVAYPLAPLLASAAGGASAAAMLVVVYVGIIAAIALPAFRKYMERSRSAAVSSPASMSETPAAKDAPLDVVAGDLFRWTFHSPGEAWQAIPNTTARKSNALADRWITRPDLDAHIMVIAEPLSSRMTLDQLERAVVANLKRSTPSFRVTKRAALNHGRVLYAEADLNGVAIAYRYGLFATRNYAYQVMTFAPEKNMATVEPELIRALASFTAE